MTRSWPHGRMALLVLLGGGGALAGDGALTPVAAIFEGKCLGCHGQKVQKGELSLATLEGLLAGGRRGPVVAPGKPDESFLLEMVSPLAGNRPRMPAKGEPLAPAEVDALRRWIAAGAPWPEGRVLSARDGSRAKEPEDPSDWWSLRPLQCPPIPPAPAEHAFWPRTPVDRFIVAALKERGLEPSPEAGRRVLIRRLAYDLHGLPPAPEEIAAFENDPAPDAYERLVDRLLASPRQGERWARHWLDVVHYGETHGFDKDKLRPNSWPYRDYVIRAFNDDKPYPRFVEEQLAGDVLYPDEPDGVIATGFIAAGPWDYVGHVELREGTVDKLITRSLDRDDMVMAAMSTFASTTVHCARCHDHKFDPIPQKDYYRLQAVFAGVDRAERPYDADGETQRRRRLLTAEVGELERRRRAVDEAVQRLTSPAIELLDGRLQELQAEIARLGGGQAEAAQRKKASALGYHSRIAGGPDTVKWVQVDLGRTVSLEEVILFPAHVEHGGHPGPGFGFPPRYRVELSGEPDFAVFKTAADHSASDFPHPGDAPVIIPCGGKEARYLRVTATRLWKRSGDWIFALAELAAIAGGENVAAGSAVSALDSIEAPPDWSLKSLTDGHTSLESLAGYGPGARSPTNGYHGAILLEPDAVQWVQVDLGASIPIDRVRLAPARPVDFPDTPGFGFPVRFRVEAGEDPGFQAGRVLADHTGADFPNPGDQQVEIEGGGARGRYVRVTATRLWTRTGDHVFALSEMQVLSAGRNAAFGAAVAALDSIEAGLWSRRHLVDGFSSRGRLESLSSLVRQAEKRQRLTGELLRLTAERAALADLLLEPGTRREKEQVGARLAALERQMEELPPPRMVYAAARRFKGEGSFQAPASPRPVHLLHRGSVTEPGELVAPGALSILEDLSEHFRLDDPDDEGSRRAALARWVLDRRNPLSWRSAVNRVWQYHFGRAIADSPNDFGRMGSRPTHPELLDWLAVWFRDRGGSLKDLHRLLLLSAVYRQSSAGHPAAEGLDAGNLYLWRRNRARLEAEEVRDAVLAAGGRLDLAMGGPSDQQFFFKDDHSPVYDYRRCDIDAPGSRRRSVYRFIVRSVPDPFMECLDCADPSLLMPRRYATLTALQALALLNNPFMARQAEHFAARLKDGAEDLRGQVELACELALGRWPLQEELEPLSEYAGEHGLENFCRLVFNLNEFVFID